MNLSAELTGRIGTAALLHDLGKMGMPGYLFSKTEPLTQEEFHIIKQHPSASTQILAPLGIFYHELQIIRHHHERFDGKGYPDGLKGREIEIGARVVAVADAFDAITSDHLHRKGQTYEKALNVIHDGAGSQFDPEVVEAFLKACEKHHQEWPLAKFSSVNNSTPEMLMVQT
jgi:HD-GYP domain-containing protein (c-di-GMP phosphodiesterase class II)